MKIKSPGSHSEVQMCVLAAGVHLHLWLIAHQCRATQYFLDQDLSVTLKALPLGRQNCILLLGGSIDPVQLV